MSKYFVGDENTKWMDPSIDIDHGHKDVAEHIKKKFHPSGNRGFHHADMHKAAEELRLEGKGSHDPVYENSKKNK